jgi:hypothetical protein
VRECAREGASNRPGGVGGLEAGSWKTVGSGWKAVGIVVGIVVGSLNFRLEGGWKGLAHHSDTVAAGATTRRCRCFDGGPKVSTMIRLAVSSRSIALARAAAAHPSADGMAANSFGA